MDLRAHGKYILLVDTLVTHFIPSFGNRDLGGDLSVWLSRRLVGSSLSNALQKYMHIYAVITRQILYIAVYSKGTIHGG